MDFLVKYEVASGQKFNRSKTTLVFNKFTLEPIRITIKEIMRLQEIQHYEKYLGLLSLVGKGKKASFNHIKERVWRKLQGWKGKLLS